MLIIEEVFLSRDENARKKMLEDIVVYMIKHEKILEESCNAHGEDSGKNEINL